MIGGRAKEEVSKKLQKSNTTIYINKIKNNIYMASRELVQYQIK
jgi:hypothetical protein